MAQQQPLICRLSPAALASLRATALRLNQGQPWQVPGKLLLGGNHHHTRHTALMNTKMQGQQSDMMLHKPRALPVTYYHHSLRYDEFAPLEDFFDSTRLLMATPM
jgi:hypothetical protein